MTINDFSADQRVVGRVSVKGLKPGLYFFTSNLKLFDGKTGVQMTGQYPPADAKEFLESINFPLPLSARLYFRLL
jgi:hypothetical protein